MAPLHPQPRAGHTARTEAFVSARVGTWSPVAVSPEAPGGGPSSPGHMPPTLVSLSFSSYHQVTKQVG